MSFEKFFGHDIDYSKAVSLWSWHHVLLSLFALGSILITLKYAKRIKDSKYEKKIRYAFIGILLFLEVTYHIHNWTYPRFSIPLNICSFALFMLVYLLYTNDERIFRYAYFFGTLGGLMALIIPTSLGYTYYNFRYYHFIVVHSVLIMIPIYYYKAYGFRVTYKDLLHVYLVTVSMTFILYLFNNTFGLNYWYINYIPINIDYLFKDYFTYVISWYVVVFTSMNLLYLLTIKKQPKDIVDFK
ncbi:MAG: TIGR02206 family membrane protein [Candidatus Izemoplasma sp.]